MAMGLWDKEGVINIVDGRLSQLQREEQGLYSRKVSQHHAKTGNRLILKAGQQEG